MRHLKKTSQFSRRSYRQNQSWSGEDKKLNVNEQSLNIRFRFAPFLPYNTSDNAIQCNEYIQKQSSLTIWCCSSGNQGQKTWFEPHLILLLRSMQGSIQQGFHSCIWRLMFSKTDFTDDIIKERVKRTRSWELPSQFCTCNLLKPIFCDSQLDPYEVKQNTLRETISWVYWEIHLKGEIQITCFVRLLLLESKKQILNNNFRLIYI